MKIKKILIVAFIGLWLSFSSAPALAANSEASGIQLPPPHTEGDLSIEETIKSRRSVRSFSSAPLSLEQLGQVLWAAQGITSAHGGRSAPSAGGLYPLELYIVIGHVTGVKPGIYRYENNSHSLALVKYGEDLRKPLSVLAVNQSWIANGAVILVIAGVYERTMAKYGERAQRYVHIETGHAAQNIYLQATSLGLGTTMVGAFKDQEVKALLDMDKTETPLALMPLGLASDENKTEH